MKNGLLILHLLLCSCVSYYDGYEQDYYTNTYTGYNYYDSPLRLRGFEVNDFSMMDNNFGDYFDVQMWDAAGHLSHFAIHSILQGMARY